MPRGKYRKVHNLFSTNTKKLANGMTVRYKMKYINSIKFMANWIPHFADNLAEGLHKGKRRDYKYCLDYVNVIDDLLIFNCSDCNNNHKKEFDQDLAKIFEKTYGICDDGINKSYPNFRKGVYPCEYMNSWKRFSETLLPPKKEF